jgi:hypothetical protein
VSENHEPLLSEFTPEILKVRNEPLKRNGTVGSRRPERSPLIVEYKVMLASKRFDRGP